MPVSSKSLDDSWCRLWVVRGDCLSCFRPEVQGAGKSQSAQVSSCIRRSRSWWRTTTQGSTRRARLGSTVELCRHVEPAYNVSRMCPGCGISPIECKIVSIDAPCMCGLRALCVATVCVGCLKVECVSKDDDESDPKEPQEVRRYTPGCATKFRPRESIKSNIVCIRIGPAGRQMEVCAA